MKAAFRLAVLLCAALALCGCGRSATYRYKLTLSLDTSDGVKTGFNVVEATFFDVSIPAKGVMHKTKGQALYIDLGPGRRPLIALLTHIRRANENLKDIRWNEDDPTDIFRRLCLGWTGSKYYDDRVNGVSAIAADCQKPFAIGPADLPDLVTFADINDPKSVMLVDPNALAATLGSGVSWRSMTLQATDDALTTGIEGHLQWLGHYGHFIPINEINSFDYGAHSFLTLLNFVREK